MGLKKITEFLYNYKYQLLLFGLVQQLFIGIILRDLDFYVKRIWAFNMFVLAVTSAGVFLGKGRWKNLIKNLILLIIVIIPLLYPFFEEDINYMSITSLVYLAFFAFVSYEVILFLIKPGYINIDIIFAALCGFMLLLEMSVFTMSYIYLSNPNSLSGLNEITAPADSFINLVYFCSIILTTIGFGDITPQTHSARLVVSLIGWVGHFYSVILVGILVGKFSSSNSIKSKE